MIDTVAIVGAGQMGRGIAQVCVAAGCTVIIYDPNPKALQKAATLGVTCVSDMTQLQSADLFIEAAPEDVELKKQILRHVADLKKPEALIATNTSSLSITHLATATSCPHLVIGLHFMNPVPRIPLVEIIRGLETAQSTFSAIQDWVKRLGKTAVVSADRPGFIVNRLLIPLINEAIFMLQESVASCDAIDAAMRLAASHPMGPLQLADFIGLDTCLAIMETLHADLGEDKYRPCPLLQRYVDAGWLGRKSGKGFYTYGDTG